MFLISVSLLTVRMCTPPPIPIPCVSWKTMDVKHSSNSNCQWYHSHLVLWGTNVCAFQVNRVRIPCIMFELVHSKNERVFINEMTQKDGCKGKVWQKYWLVADWWQENGQNGWLFDSWLRQFDHLQQRLQVYAKSSDRRSTSSTQSSNRFCPAFTRKQKQTPS